jgi:pimeloyl-ACP methyl ester carboxylesterase
MTAVFVHGNPETPVIWNPLLDELGHADTVCLALPGFGNCAPSGFDATKEAYVDWLVAQLESMGEPVDLVGHDWGGGFSLRVACLRPDLLRSWVSDVPHLFDTEYVWHDFAQIWQTPGAGEEFFAQSRTQPRDERVAGYEAIGIRPRAIAETLVDAGDDEMARCVLALYRSAAQPAMHAWGRDVEHAAARPGMVLINELDPFVRDHALGRRVGARAGAIVREMPGVGHWWMLEDPAGGARLLRDFWAAL